MKQTGRIRQKVQRLVFFVSINALLISMLIGGGAMYRLQAFVSDSGETLVSKITKETNSVLLTRSLQTLSASLSTRAQNANNSLTALSEDVELFAEYAETYYQFPENYIRRNVLSPNEVEPDVVTLHKIMRSEDIVPEDVADEIGLLGNLEDLWRFILERNQDIVSSIYVGTESGFLLILDEYGSDRDNLYQFDKSAWYTAAEEAGELTFTAPYQDYYGHGLMITCAIPFHKPDGSFAGVIGMDILIADISRSLIQISAGKNSDVFLMDKTGNIIASPTMDGTEEEFVNIVEDTSAVGHSISRLLLGGASGLAKYNDDFYFAYTSINATDWTLVLQISTQDLLEPLSHLGTVISSSTDATLSVIKSEFIFSLQIYLVLLLLIAVVVLILSYNFSKRMTKPLAQLRTDVEQISSGNLEYRTQVATSDEIGELAIAFNRMSQSLQNQIQALTKMTAEKERIGAELNIATQIQISMLPYIFPAFPDRPDFDIYATMTPAKEVGGDFYDFYLLDETHLALEIADVSGKGVPAALFMAIAKALLKSAVQSGLSPKDALAMVNNQLGEGNPTCMFVTVWLGILDLHTGNLICSNAGHEYPVIRRKGGEYELIKDKHGPAVGVMEGIRFREYELNLNVGDRFFIYTDGVPEATSAQEELFGNDRMLAALNKHVNDSCYDLLPHMKAEIDAFVGDAPQFDDITMLTVEINELH